MKSFIKVVQVFMILLSFMSITACGDKEVERVILKHLKQKYGEEFVVKGVGGRYGTLTTNTIKALVYPKDQPNKEFEVEITKDLKKIWDRYMNVLMAEKLDQAATAMAAPTFQDEIWVKSYIDSGLSFPDIELNNKGMNLKDYLKTKSKMNVLIRVFVNCKSDIDIGLQAEKIEKLADESLAYGMKDVYISVFYLKSSAFKDIKTEYYDVENPVEYYLQKERNYNRAWTEIIDFKKKQNLEEIKNNFQFK